MVLKRDVRGTNGMVILGRGAEITDRHIAIFRSWGVIEAEVETEAAPSAVAPPPEPLTPAQRQAVEGELERLFRHNDPTDPVIEELLAICRQRLTLKKATHG